MGKNRILFELGCEELPVDAINILRNEFGKAVKAALSSRSLSDYSLKEFSTPRRYVLLFENIPLNTPVETEEVKGPPVTMFYDESGALTKQGEGFLKSKQLNADQIVKKNGFVFYRRDKGGERTADIISDEIVKILSSLEFDKRMIWDKTGFAFPRPVRWAILFENDSAVDMSIGGVKSSDFTFGNRCCGNRKLQISGIGDYFRKLAENNVTVSRAERRSAVLTSMKETAEELSDELIEDDGLLDEVTDLVEYPAIFAGEFDERFLNIPDEIIIAALKQHQRYFTLRKKNGTLSNRFLFVSNNPFGERSEIISNNRRIITARLDDAEFYFNNDISRTLDEYRESMKKTVYQEQLGSVYDKVLRNAALAEFVDGMLDNRMKNALYLSELSKFDLTTEMIKDGKEFTKLQGVIGWRYAEKMGIPEKDAVVSYEHYLPVTNNGKLPMTYEGLLFSIADKTDSITGAFITGNKPTGSKDVMGVRRSVISLLYLLLEAERDIDLKPVIEKSVSLYGDSAKNGLADEIVDFINTRAENMLQAENLSYDVVRCFLSRERIVPADIRRRAATVRDVKNSDDFKDIAIGIKRVNNILSGQNPSEYRGSFSEKFEKELYEGASRVMNENVSLYEKNDYTKILSNLLKLRSPIDAFFDNVMVMDEDAAARERKLYLLSFVRSVFSAFGDFSFIVFEGDSQ